MALLLLPFSGLRPPPRRESTAAAAATAAATSTTTSSWSSCHQRWQQMQQEEHHYYGGALLIAPNRFGRNFAFKWTRRTVIVQGAAHSDHGVSWRFVSRVSRASRASKARGSDSPSHPFSARVIICCSSSSCSEVAVDKGSEFSQPAASSSSSSSSSEQPSSVVKQFTVRGAQIDAELWAAACIRAECYFEDQPHVRYLDSYKKHFAEQEFMALKRRVLGNYGQCIKCICFVAINHEQQQSPFINCGPDDIVGAELGQQVVIGSLDLSVRRLSPGESFPGECISSSSAAAATTTSEGYSTISITEDNQESSSHRYGYIANVCVAKPGRRNGVASELVGAGIEAAKDWGLTEVFVHVDFDNEAACRLYSKHKFEARHTGVVQIDSQSAIVLQRSL